MNNKFCRIMIPCVYLINKSCVNLRPNEMLSIVIVASCWFVSIRLFGLIGFFFQEKINHYYSKIIY